MRGRGLRGCVGVERISSHRDGGYVSVLRGCVGGWVRIEELR